jgi:aspartyl-tRNA(Asn)/glutamyl-tRNA(Gln) amidotransferase subunit C
MLVTFSRSEVQAIARLAQLELDESETDLFSRQLGEILEYAVQVQQIDTTGVQPTTAILARPEADRPDTVADSLARTDALANAPDPSPDGAFFRVPRVIG